MTIPAPEVAELHGQYARVWERATDQTPSARAAHLALHHDGANHPNQAYAWSLRSADLASETFAWAEESQHLRRACLLWPRVRPAPGTQADHATLLWRASESARHAGRYGSALDLGEQALAAFDEKTHPLEVAGLLARVSDLRVQLDSTRNHLDEARHMLALTEQFPQSEERVIALALLVAHELLRGGPHAATLASQAIDVAQLVGSDSALALGFAVASETHLGSAECVAYSGRAVDLARSSRQDTLTAHCAIAQYNCLVSLGQRAAAADAMLALLREFIARGAFYESVPLISCAASLLVELGRWAEAREVLREGLGRRIDSEWGAEIRRAAADLAARTGDLAAAAHHLARATEISPGTPVVGYTAASTDVRVAWAAGDQPRALARSEDAMPALVRLDDPAADDLLVWSARAAADLAEEPGMRPKALAWLERIAAARGVAPAPFRARAADDLISPAWGLLHEAEHSRCAGEGPEQERAWEAASAACRDAGLPWEQALSSYHLARCLLVRSRDHHDDHQGDHQGDHQSDHRRAAAALREAAAIGRQLGAEPLLRDVSALALQSHICLDEPSVPPLGEHEPWPLGDPTPREREILAHLLAGRTYAEIAAALYISEKTVSVHVSNLLRKTGTANRIELTELARRLTSEGRVAPDAR